MSMYAAARHFSGADYLEYVHIKWLTESPREAAVAAVTLRYLPTYLDILPLYLVLLGIAPMLDLPRQARLPGGLTGLLRCVSDNVDHTFQSDGGPGYRGLVLQSLRVAASLHHRDGRVPPK